MFGLMTSMVVLQRKGEFMRNLYLVGLSCLVLSACADLNVAKTALKGGDYEVAVEQYTTLADFGYAEAQIELGKILVKEKGGYAPDYEKAKILFERAAAQGNGQAMAELGRLYAQGLGVARNGAKSLYWFKEAVNAGYSKAWYDLGVLYHKGELVPKNNALALDSYINVIREEDYTRAYFQLGELYSESTSPANIRQAIDYYNVALSRGYARSARSIAGLYRKGAGDLGKNTVMTLAYYMIAANGGIESANRDIEKLQQNMTAAQIARARQVAAQIQNGGNYVR